MLKADKLGDDVGDLVTRRAIIAGTAREFVHLTDQWLVCLAMLGVVMPCTQVDEA